MKNIFILLFSITCLLAQDTKEVENTNEGKFSGVTYFDYTYLDSLGSFDIKRAELKYAKKLSEKYFFKMVLDVNRDVSGADIDKRLTAHIRNAQLTMRLGQKSFLYLGVSGSVSVGVLTI